MQKKSFEATLFSLENVVLTGEELLEIRGGIGENNSPSVGQGCGKECGKDCGNDCGQQCGRVCGENCSGTSGPPPGSLQQ